MAKHKVYFSHSPVATTSFVLDDAVQLFHLGGRVDLEDAADRVVVEPGVFNAHAISPA